MNWIRNLITKVSGYFSNTSNPSILGEDVLCVFLRYDSDYLFAKSEEPKPLMFSVNILSSVEENATKIAGYLFDEFGISPEKIDVYLGLLSLKPLFNKTLSFATVDLTKEEFEELKGSFTSYSLPQISIQSDSNLFFNVLTRILLSK